MNEQEQMSFFYEIFSPSLNRQGPGSDKSTSKAIKIIQDSGISPNLFDETKQSRLLDIGSGTGAQTMVLAREMECDIIALDNHKPFLSELALRAENKGLDSRIKTIHQDMNELKVSRDIYDIIWAEGSMFIVGIPQALKLAYRLLPEGGIFVFSDLLVFNPEIPKVCLDFFADECGSPLMNLDEVNREILGAGFKIVDNFSLPESDWLDTYYAPLESRIVELAKRHKDDKDRLSKLEEVQVEIDMYKQYSDYYGYQFYIIVKR